MENFRLRVFRAVAEEMSFRKAAEVLHLSQPAVSQHVRALEEETGVQLFDRARGEGHGSQISLTEAGRVLLGYANTAAETMVDARRALAALNDEVVGELKLGASTTVAQYVLPRILGAFLRQYPQVKLSLVSGNTERIVEEVAEKKVALGIIEGPAMRRDVKTERMVRDEMVLIVSPNHAFTLRKGGGDCGVGVGEGAFAVAGAGIGFAEGGGAGFEEGWAAAAVAEGGDGAGFYRGDYLGGGGGAGCGVCFAVGGGEGVASGDCAGGCGGGVGDCAGLQFCLARGVGDARGCRGVSAVCDGFGRYEITDRGDK